MESHAPAQCVGKSCLRCRFGEFFAFDANRTDYPSCQILTGFVLKFKLPPAQLYSEPVLRDNLEVGSSVFSLYRRWAAALGQTTSVSLHCLPGDFLNMQMDESSLLLKAEP